MNVPVQVLCEAFGLLRESSVYVLFGLLVSGLLRVYLDPGAVARHLGRGRFRSVIKAALLGIPLPLCSCGVLPAAVSLKKQGANKGATTAFMISTPESGVDSIAVTYALLDPVMTLARPTAAFITAVMAGITENCFQEKHPPGGDGYPDLTCPVDGCCDGLDCTPEAHRHHHTFGQKARAGLRYALTDVWEDMALWFFLGLVLAGAVSALVSEELMVRYLGGGLSSMSIMLAMGIPLYICATASTPIAAALILKGVSPGAALVFLLAGPATNVTSLTVLLGTLGTRATAIYLGSIAVCSVAFGLLVDRVYLFFGISARAVMGHAQEFVPAWAEWTGAGVLLLLYGMSIPARISRLRRRRGLDGAPSDPGHAHSPSDAGCAAPT